MKRFLIAASLLFGVALAQTATAQVAVINIGSQPVWGPVGYDYVEYYYLPDIDMYYHVPTQQYVYLVNRRWVFARVLPPHLRGYDIYRGYKVVINEPRPYLYHDRYRKHYGHYRGRMGQPIIRDSRDNRYFANPGHPEHHRPGYAYRNQNHYRDYYNNRYEPDYRRPNNRDRDREAPGGDWRNDTRNNNDNRFRDDNGNQFRNDKNNRLRNDNNRSRYDDNRFRGDNNNRFRNEQGNKDQYNNRYNRGRN